MLKESWNWVLLIKVQARNFQVCLVKMRFFAILPYCNTWQDLATTFFWKFSSSLNVEHLRLVCISLYIEADQHRKILELRFWVSGKVDLDQILHAISYQPSQLVSAAEILLRHLWNCHSKQIELIANVLIGLILLSDYNLTYFSNTLEHLDVSKDISKTFFIFAMFYAKNTPKFRNLSPEGATFHLCVCKFFIWCSTKTY